MESTIVTYIDRLVGLLGKAINIRSMGSKDFIKYLGHMIECVEGYRTALKKNDFASAISRIAEFETYKDKFEERLFGVISTEEAQLFQLRMQNVYHFDINPTNIRIEEALKLFGRPKHPGPLPPPPDFARAPVTR